MVLACRPALEVTKYASTSRKPACNFNNYVLSCYDDDFSANGSKESGVLIQSKFMDLMKRTAIAKVTAVGALAVLVLAGAVGIYYYTMAPKGNSTPSGSVTSSSLASNTSLAGNNSSQQGPTGGTCGTNAQGQCTQPQGAWAEYLGYIPTGYTLAPHYPIAPTYQCPSGMNPAQCALFRASCGNGVCDPNESCTTCPIDCGINGQLTCDPYTGRPGNPVSVCQVGQIG